MAYGIVAAASYIQPMDTGPTAQPITIWYDGACPLCLREIAAMRRLDRGNAIDFVDVSDANAPQSCPVERETLLKRFHARDADGTLHSGAAAFAVMWRAIPLLKPLGHLARIPVILGILEWLYHQFLKIRPQLQRVAGKR